MNKDKLRKQLEIHEGKKLESYLCPTGHLTIGVGRHIEAHPVTGELGRTIDRVGMEITNEEAMKLLNNDIDNPTHQDRREIRGQIFGYGACPHTDSPLATGNRKNS